MQGLYETTQANKNLTEQIILFVVKELKKTKLTRFDIISKIEKEFEDAKNIHKISRKVTSDILYSKAKTLNIKSESVKKEIKSSKKSYTTSQFWIETKSNKIKKFDDFEPDLK